MHPSVQAALDNFVPVLLLGLGAVVVFNLLVISALVISRTRAGRIHRRAIESDNAHWPDAYWYIARRVDRDGADYADTLYLLQPYLAYNITPTLLIDWAATGRTFQELADLHEAGFTITETYAYLGGGEDMDPDTVRMMGSLRSMNL